MQPDITGSQLPLMEIFSSLQGEGYHTGRAAAFLRIGGCDVGCHWCDIKESWNARLHPMTPVEDIFQQLRALNSSAVVITGGEPLMYELGPLCRGLKEMGMAIFLETSGAYPLSGQFDWICVSPKTQMPPRPELLLMADELKVIVQYPEDLAWAEKMAGKVKDKCQLYLQAEWSRFKEITPAIVDYAMAHHRWRVSLQAHKFMRIP